MQGRDGQTSLLKGVCSAQWRGCKVTSSITYLHPTARQVSQAEDEFCHPAALSPAKAVPGPPCQWQLGWRFRLLFSSLGPVDLNPTERTADQKYRLLLVFPLPHAKEPSNAKAKNTCLTCTPEKVQRLFDGLCHATTS